jgi:hypothetical protein
VTYETVRRIALALPGVEDGISYGTPSLKVKGKFLARLREDGETVAIRAEFPVREALMQEEPGMFFSTDHYLDYPAVLVRLSKVDPIKLRRLVEHGWRAAAPKSLVRAFDTDRSCVVAKAGRLPHAPPGHTIPAAEAP